MKEIKVQHKQIMTQQQKLDIEKWICLQTLQLMEKLSAHPIDGSFEEKSIIAVKLSVYSEIAGLMSGELIVSDDYTELRPA